MLTRERSLDDPAEFAALPPSEQAALLAWIRLVCHPVTRVEREWTSYGLKHHFEDDGFYVTNGAFKGAMVAVGYSPTNPQECNWHFRVAPCCRCHRPGTGCGYWLCPRHLDAAARTAVIALIVAASDDDLAAYLARYPERSPQGASR